MLHLQLCSLILVPSISTTSLHTHTHIYPINNMLLSNFYYIITLLSLITTVTCSEEKMISRKLRNSVVVIGSGAAGLASAIEASNAGSMVYLLEKMSNVGGNSAKASSGCVFI